MGFDVRGNIRLVPVFREKDMDTYFILFERVATTLKWPQNVWTLLLQCVLIRRAQEVYAALSPENSLDYEKVKACILRAYELVLEAYQQKFRRLKKLELHTYVEFSREKEMLFDK